MNGNDISSNLRRDTCLTEAVRRDNMRLPSLPDCLNEQVLSRMNLAGERRRKVRKTVWMATAFASATAACLILLFWPGNKAKHDQPTIIPSKPVATMNPPVGKDKKDAAIEQSSPRIEIIAEQTAQTQTDEKKTQQEKTEPRQYITAHCDEPFNAIGQQLGMKRAAIRKKKTEVGKKPSVRDAKESISQKEEPREPNTLMAEIGVDSPDTLGSSIFQSPENILIAVRMLSECDDIINRETREFRNDVIEASFNVVPPAAKAILVKDENGDLNVVETNSSRIVEL